MMTFREIVEEARLWAASNPEEIQTKTSSIRPEVSSLPETRAFVNKVLELCEANGIRIDDPSKIISHADFSAQFKSSAVDNFYQESGFKRRPMAAREELLGFASQVAGESKEGDLLRTFIPETDGLSAVDDDFMYKAHLVRSIAEQEQQKIVEPQSNFSILDYEIALLAEECYEIEIEKMKKNNGGQLLRNTENNNRSIAVIIGPPGAGKSSVKGALNEGYFSVDLDDIAIYIKNKKRVDLNANKDPIYKCAEKISSIMMAKAFKDGFNVTVEKIGHSKEEIYWFTNKYKSIAEQEGCVPSADLYCVHTSNKASTVRAMNRTMNQIKYGTDLRFYSDIAVYGKDNSPAYAYLEVLKDQMLGESEPVFDSMMIRINEGLSEEEAVLDNLAYNNETREKKKEVISSIKHAQIQKQREDHARESAKLDTQQTKNIEQMGE